MDGFQDVIGLKDLRRDITDIYSKAINDFAYIRIGNIKTKSKTASILSTNLLKEILKCYKFTSTQKFDKVTNQIEVYINEIHAYGYGDTDDEAIDMVIKNVLSLTTEYFNNIELYMRLEDTKVQFSYFLRIKNCDSKDELLEVLTLKNIITDREV